jgi:PAS domain S-box-containing protein
VLHRTKRAARRRPRRPPARAEILRRSLSLLRAAIDSTADGILVVDRAGRVSAHNRRFAEMWGLGALLGAGGDDAAALAAVHAQLRDPEAFLARVRTLYGMPEAESFDALDLRDGRVFERTSQPQRVGGRVVGRVWCFRDVTDRRRAELERDRLLVEEQAARLAAERALRARDEFFQVASHELKTPLTSLLLAVQQLLRLVRRGEGGGDPLLRALGVVDRQGRRLAALVDVLLDVSRLRVAPLELRREDLDLAELVRGVAAEMAVEAASAGSAVALALPAPVPGSWDRARVAQALTCLVANAFKYGRGRPVEIACDVVGGVAQISVRDFGPGIGPGHLDRIFERFERAMAASHYAGLGLGLYFARRIAEAHGGTLGVESALDQGSTFTLRLPRA